MKKQLLTGALAVSTLAVAAFAQISPAQALGAFKFTNIQSNNVSGDNIVNYFSFDVNAESTSQVGFTFFNKGSLFPDKPTITGVFFDQINPTNSPLSSIVSATGTDVNFTTQTCTNNAGGCNFAQGANVVPRFTTNFVARASAPAPTNGVDPNETLKVLFNLASGKTVNDVIDALRQPNPQLNIGLRVQEIGSNGQASDSYLSFVPATPPAPIPTPALIPAALGMSAALLRKKNQEEEAGKA
jgi:hypothetical protein